MLAIVATQAKMTDQQVIDYVKEQVAAGKDYQTIGKELLAQGVTADQVKRLQSQYQSGQLDAELNDATKRAADQAIQRSTAGSTTSAATQRIEKNAKTTSKTGKTSKSSSGSNSSTTTAVPPNSAGFQVVNPIDALVMGMEEEDLMEEEEEEETTPIFGHDLFQSYSLSFEPNENLATPTNYRLGPGDEVVIDIWGASEDQIRQTISPEGSIIIENIGPLYLNGLTVRDANSRVSQALASKYAGIDDGTTDVSLALGQIRSIQINVMGEVEVPGTYWVSPFSSVFNALYRAGGINDIGSLRNIQVIRDGRRIVDVDVYSYLFDGLSSDNIRLQEGDVVIVPPYDELVTIEGNVKRPMAYEMKPGETVEDLVSYAGGFKGDAYPDVLVLARWDGRQNLLYNIDTIDFDQFELRDGDLVTIGGPLERVENRVELKGSVRRPGVYGITPDVATVATLIAKAQGLTEDAFTNRALLMREGDDLSLEMISLDLAAILNGTADDILLQRNDVITIWSVLDIEDQGLVTIEGQVALPGDYLYAKGMTVEDLIVMAGGLLQGASTSRVDVSRRLTDPSSTSQTNILAQTFTFALKDGLTVEGDPGFKLKPYDIVEIRTSPGYQVQRMVEVSGEVLFAGKYALQQRNERLSELVERAGGVIDGAYVKGARLLRLMTDDEKASRAATLRLITQTANSEDSISTAQLDLGDTYSVGIDLEYALAHPGSKEDVVLMDGDQLIIPQEASTVKIGGAVMFPNTVVYKPGMKLKHYIEQAGGYSPEARKKKAFIVYMNGQVAVAKKNTPIEPGCQIIVPAKPQHSGMTTAQVLTWITGLSTVTTMAATIYNLVK